MTSAQKDKHTHYSHRQPLARPSECKTEFLNDQVSKKETILMKTGTVYVLLSTHGRRAAFKFAHMGTLYL